MNQSNAGNHLFRHLTPRRAVGLAAAALLVAASFVLFPADAAFRSMRAAAQQQVGKQAPRARSQRAGDRFRVVRNLEMTEQLQSQRQPSSLSE